MAWRVSGGFFTSKEQLTAASCLPNILVSKPDAIGNAMDLFFQARSIELPNPQSPRAVHADLSLTGDLTGLAAGHIAQYDERGLPRIDIDALGRIHPPRNGQIDIDSVLQLVANWKRAGVPIVWFSCDGYMSADLLQRVSRLGIKTGRLSADQTTPGDPAAAYECLRIAIAEGRYRFPHDPETVADMLALQIDRAKNKVDHLPGQKKDVSDCLAAIAYHLTHNVQAFAFADRIEGAAFAAAIARPHLGGTVTGIQPPLYGGFDSHMELVRFQRGIGSSGGGWS